jgi:hypothetical protein
MANGSGIGALGATLAGANKPNEDVAYAQGVQMGSNTQNALAEARLRVQKGDALDYLTNMTPEQEAAQGMHPGQAKVYAALMANSEHPLDYENALKEHLTTQARSAELGANLSGGDINRLRSAAGDTPVQFVHAVGEGGSTDMYGSGNVDTTALGQSLIDKNEAQGSLYNQERLTPEKFHPSMLPSDPKALNDVAWALHNGYNPGSPRQGGAGVATALRTIDDPNGLGTVAGAPPVAPGPSTALAPPGPGDNPKDNPAALAAANALAPKPSAADYAPAGVPGAPPVAPPAVAPPATAPAPVTGGGFNLQNQKQAVKAFSPGGGPNSPGQQVQFVNRAGGHLAVYDQLVDALNNGDVQVKNKAMNALKTEFGNAAPTNIDTAAPFVVGEVMRAMAGANAGTLNERSPLEAKLGNTASPDQAHQAAGVLRSMVREQALALQQQYKQTGKHDFTSAQLRPEIASALNIQEDNAAPAGSLSAEDQALVNSYLAKGK